MSMSNKFNGHGISGKMAGFKISTRLYTGFAILLLAILMLAITSFRGMKLVETDFDHSRELSEQSLLISELERDLALMQAEELKFLTKYETQDKKAYTEAYDLVQKIMAQAKQKSSNAERLQLLQAAEKELISHNDSFNRISQSDTRQSASAGIVSLDVGKIFSHTSKARKSVETEARHLRDEVAGDISKMEASTLITASLALVIGSLAAFLIGRSITSPINALALDMNKLSEGDLAITVSAVGRGDEIGKMAQAVQVFKENAIRNRELEKEQQQQKQRAEEEKRDMMHKLADQFNSSVGGIVQSVSSASTELQATSESMSNISNNTSSLASAVSAASEEASCNVQTVAAAAEEMSHSIGVINEQVNQAASAARQAVEHVDKTGSQMQKLADTANRIGEVVSLISDIAEQTNLLALNATIESARAGEAGRGFAVVASEVKSLASQTSKATDGIAAQVEEIQRATKEAVSSMTAIGQSIRSVDETSSAIASAMQEQGAATQEIARNVQEAATGTEEVSKNITGVNEASQESGASANEVTRAASELSEQSELLTSEVERFINQVRSA